MHRDHWPARPGSRRIGPHNTATSICSRSSSSHRPTSRNAYRRRADIALALAIERVHPRPDTVAGGVPATAPKRLPRRRGSASVVTSLGRRSPSVAGVDLMIEWCYPHCDGRLEIYLDDVAAVDQASSPSCGLRSKVYQLLADFANNSQLLLNPSPFGSTANCCDGAAFDAATSRPSSAAPPLPSRCRRCGNDSRRHTKRPSRSGNQPLWHSISPFDAARSRVSSAAERPSPAVSRAARDRPRHVPTPSRWRGRRAHAYRTPA